MARPKQGIIFSLEAVLAKLLETNQALYDRVVQLESALMGDVVAVKKGRKPGRPAGHKRGRKPSGKVCSVPGCGRKHAAKGLCANHYQQKRMKDKEKAAPAKK